jgi:hypothetical protein
MAHPLNPPNSWAKSLSEVWDVDVDVVEVVCVLVADELLPPSELDSTKKAVAKRKSELTQQ